MTKNQLEKNNGKKRKKRCRRSPRARCVHSERSRGAYQAHSMASPRGATWRRSRRERAGDDWATVARNTLVRALGHERENGKKKKKRFANKPKRSRPSARPMRWQTGRKNTLEAKTCLSSPSPARWATVRVARALAWRIVSSLCAFERREAHALAAQATRDPPPFPTT